MSLGNGNDINNIVSASNLNRNTTEEVCDVVMIELYQNGLCVKHISNMEEIVSIHHQTLCPTPIYSIISSNSLSSKIHQTRFNHWKVSLIRNGIHRINIMMDLFSNCIVRMVMTLNTSIYRIALQLKMIILSIDTALM